MHPVDYLIFGFYMLIVLGVGFYFYRRNTNSKDYYIGGGQMRASHVGLSIVATDVGGGFSIGLGGVGFTMGLAGSWLLFTGLVGAWLSAVLIIPRIKALERGHTLMSYPDLLRLRYKPYVALAAALVSGIGYLGFTAAQLLAGAKLAAVTLLPPTNPLGISPHLLALLTIAVVTILYTVFGGLKAVIYTDTVQWIVLLAGLIFVTAPVAVYEIGGFAALKEALPPSHFSLGNIEPMTFLNWMITIIPIWLVGMTLYQRAFACSDVKTAKRAWYIAGIFEYPIMAFTGVFLGMCARVLFPGADAEAALPQMIHDVLPLGVAGIVIAAYFSAIMSTADSCLMAASGNVVGDLLRRLLPGVVTQKREIKISMLITLLLGILAVALAARFTTVLDAILYAYAFMVSGLVAPTLGALFWKRATSLGALVSMIGGGGLTLCLLLKLFPLPEALRITGLDSAAYGLALSAILMIAVSLLKPERMGESNG